MNNFFKKAYPVWATDRENEMNLTLVFNANVSKSTNAILRVTGSSYYNIYVNGEFVAVGPARAAHGYFRVDELPINLEKEHNEVKIIAYGYAVNSFYHMDQPSFLIAEIETEIGVTAFTDTIQSSFTAKEWLGKIQKVQRYSFQRPFTEVYDYTVNQFADVQLSETSEVKYLPRNIFYGKYEKENAHKLIQKGLFTVEEKTSYYDDRSISNICPQLKGFMRNELDVFSTKLAQDLTVKNVDSFNESTTDVKAAIVREKQLKGWTRAKKNALVEEMNPEWRDLAVDIGFMP